VVRRESLVALGSNFRIKTAIEKAEPGLRQILWLNQVIRKARSIRAAGPARPPFMSSMAVRLKYARARSL
jgi:hypothetical protein